MTITEIKDIVREILQEGIYGLTRKDYDKIVNLQSIMGVIEKEMDDVGKQNKEIIFRFIQRNMPYIINIAYPGSIKGSLFAPFYEYFGPDVSNFEWLESFYRTIVEQQGFIIVWKEFDPLQLKNKAKYEPHLIRRYRTVRLLLQKHPNIIQDLDRLKIYIEKLFIRSPQNPLNPKNYPLFVSLYGHSRAYGGPEEGGWHYSRYSLIKSIKVNNFKEARKAVLILLKDVDSVDDDDARIYLEKTEGAEETKERPHYS